MRWLPFCFCRRVPVAVAVAVAALLTFCYRRIQREYRPLVHLQLRCHPLYSCLRCDSWISWSIDGTKVVTVPLAARRIQGFGSAINSLFYFFRSCSAISLDSGNEEQASRAVISLCKEQNLGKVRIPKQHVPILSLIPA